MTEKKIQIPEMPAAPALPKTPKVAIQIDPSQHFTSRGMLDSVAQATEPAILTLSVVSTRSLGDTAMKNGIGTTRPTKVVAGPDEARENLMLMPVHSETPGGILVRYDKNSAVINLYHVYKELDRFVPPDTRQTHEIVKTTEPIQIGQHVGWGMQFRLDQFKSKPIKRLSEEEKAARRAKQAKKDSAPSHDAEA